jgi:hypothetical protein
MTTPTPEPSPLTSPLEVSDADAEDNPGFKSSFEHVMDGDQTTHPGSVKADLHNETQVGKTGTEARTHNAGADTTP